MVSPRIMKSNITKKVVAPSSPIAEKIEEERKLNRKQKQDPEN